MNDSATPSLSVDPVNGVLRGTVEIAATPERVFEALTQPHELASWWGSEATYRTSDWHVDARPGGKWSARTIDAAGDEGHIGGEYSVVDPARALEHTWFASWDGSSPSIVRYDLDSAFVDGVAGTRLTVTHTRSDNAQMNDVRSFDFTGVITCLARHATHTPMRVDEMTRYEIRPTRYRARRPTVSCAHSGWN